AVVRQAASPGRVRRGRAGPGRAPGAGGFGGPGPARQPPRPAHAPGHPGPPPPGTAAPAVHRPVRYRHCRGATGLGGLRPPPWARGGQMKPPGLSSRLVEYGDRDFAAYMRRSFARGFGLSDEALAKPVVGIVDTASDFNNCHRTVPELVSAVERGVWQA